MNQHDRDKRDLRICELMDKAPYGLGLAPSEAAAILSRERGGEAKPHVINAQWRRIRQAMEG
jgi:hypothetical protein